MHAPDPVPTTASEGASEGTTEGASVHVCATRWADLDQLGHVNNVTYLSYLAEGRRAHSTEPGRDVVRHEVTYVAPLGFHFRPVLVSTRSASGGTVLEQEVFHEPTAGERTVYVRSRTVLGELPGADVGPPAVIGDDDDRTVAWPVPVRLTDVGAGGTVSDVALFEYFQESRIRTMAEVGRDRDLPPFSVVVAQTDVDLLAPAPLRAEPYEIRTGIGHLGRRSMRFDSAFVDPLDGRVLARAQVVAVFWDGATQGSTDPHPAVRERIAAFLTS